jgi:hypothetical protein
MKASHWLAAIMCTAAATTGANADEALHIKAVPAIDGVANEALWEGDDWYPMNEVIIGDTPGASDFTGKYKLRWNEDALYLLAEIRDDHLSDTYASPLERYWDDDCLEIFIDADGSGGDHFNNYNAFAYHLALDNQVADIGPSMAAENKGEAVPQLYNDHVDSAWQRQSDAPFVVHWEAAIKVYADDYVHGESNTPVTLKKGMKLGFMLAYCDADGGDREHFMGSHPITPIDGDKNQGYKDASVFDVLELK